MNRRSFLKVTAGVTATAAFLPPAYSVAPKRKLRKAITVTPPKLSGRFPIRNGSQHCNLGFRPFF